MLQRLFLLSVLMLPLPAQIGAGELGLMIAVSRSGFGTVCPSTFSCTYIDGDVGRGEPAEIVVRGMRLRPYALLLAADQPHQCVAVPGFHNHLMNTQVVVLLDGLMTVPDPRLSCPGGIAATPVTLPWSLPAGFVFTLQAAAFTYLRGVEVPAWSMALRVTVR